MKQLTTELAEQPAVIADKALANSLALTTGLELEEKITTDFNFAGYIITSNVSEDQLREIHSLVSETMAPAEDNDLAKGVLKLRALTAHRREGEDIDIVLEAYVEKLKAYPKDAAMETLTRLADNSKWFPSWAEIKDDVEWRCKHRTGLLKAVERKLHERQQRSQFRQGTEGTAQLVRQSANQSNLGKQQNEAEEKEKRVSAN